MMETEIECVPECNHQAFRYIKNLTKSERKQFLDSFDVVFCDCDGVIWLNFGGPIPNVDQTINFLRNQGKKVAFVTNNSVTPFEKKLKTFQDSNIDVQQEDIIHPAQSVCDYLKLRNFDGLIYCLATTSFKKILRNAGFQLAEINENLIPESLPILKAEIFKDEPIKAVIIDVDINLTATKLMRAGVILESPECLFIAGAADEKVPFGKREIIGSGPFIKIVEHAVKRKAVALGKPGSDLGEILKQRYNLHNQPHRALFIGDMLTTDVRFAKMCGFQTLLVLTGGTRAKDLHIPRPNDEIPDYVALSINDLNEL